MAKDSKNKILLQSGTNELEVVEFFVNYFDSDGKECSSCYGVNVGKVREIIKTPDVITKIAKSHPAVDGMINFRGKIVPIISIPKWLNKDASSSSFSRVIITEFNKNYSGFLVSSVSRIHRISWNNIEPPTIVMDEDTNCITGIIKFEDRIMMMLDFEKVYADINPATAMAVEDSFADAKDKGKTVMVAEDSNTVKNLLRRSIDKSGYKIIITSDGLEAYNRLMAFVHEAEEKGVSVYDLVHLVISDVEMPRMDGLHLLKKIKEHDKLKELPVIIFSSMATKENIIKWKGLGATDHLSKPDISILMDKIKQNIL